MYTCKLGRLRIFKSPSNSGQNSVLRSMAMPMWSAWAHDLSLSVAPSILHDTFDAIVNYYQGRVARVLQLAHSFSGRTLFPKRVIRDLGKLGYSGRLLPIGLQCAYLGITFLDVLCNTRCIQMSNDTNVLVLRTCIPRKSKEEQMTTSPAILPSSMGRCFKRKGTWSLWPKRLVAGRSERPACYNAHACLHPRRTTH